MTKSRLAIVFLNGEPTGLPRLAPYLKVKPLLIGCDGGTQQIIELGLVPDVIIGDFDSWPATATSVPAVTYPTDKDFTDGELAIRYALEAGCQEIILAGALGGRLDHLLGHILLLNKHEFAGLRLTIVDNTQEAFMIRGQAQIRGKKGTLISFLPVAGPVQIARTSGLRYDLSQYHMSPQHNLGISNVMLTSTAEIIITRGALLVIRQLQKS